MTNTLPSAAQMQNLLNEWEQRMKVGTADRWTMADKAKRVTRILAYIRSLEADHKAMREAIDFACDDCSCPNCDKTLCGMHERLTKVQSSLQLHE